jgi:hypothetical protein
MGSNLAYDLSYDGDDAPSMTEAEGRDEARNESNESL